MKYLKLIVETFALAVAVTWFAAFILLLNAFVN